MCGIVGFAGAGDEAVLKRMTDRLIHRGPDGEGFHCEPETGVFLGHRRLDILDIEGGRQPMWSGDGRLCIIFNGEIYNHMELRESLIARGSRFHSHHSDTETLIYAYREWGPDFVKRLNGMWAFAIYDRTARTLFCSRDRFGQKPFYYHTGPGLFAFASEASALVEHPGVSGEWNRMALIKYFAYGYIPAPNAIYRGVNKLPGGHSLLVNLNDLKVTISRYWEFELEPEHIPKDALPARMEELRELLAQAVQRRHQADVPLGVFLSGGIDSSTVAAFSTKVEPHPVFAIGFEEPGFDELAHARFVAGELGVPLQSKTLSLDKAVGLLPRIAGGLDEPMGDSSILPTYLLCEFAREKVKVALGGDGADELFAGYDPFLALGPASIYKRFTPGLLHDAVRFLVDRLPVSHAYMSLDFKLKRTLRGLGYADKLRLPIWMGPLEPRELAELFDEPLDWDTVYAEAIAAWDACNQADWTSKALCFFTKCYLQDGILTKVDRAGMLHSLEVRSPFLDIDVVNFARRLPADCKLRGRQTKYLLKHAMAPILPQETVKRTKKGFGVPIGKWFREGALTLSETSLGNKSPQRKLISDHLKGKADNRLYLWNQWLLEQWAEAQKARSK